MQQSHLSGALSARDLEAFTTSVVPAQRAPFVLTHPSLRLFHAVDSGLVVRDEGADRPLQVVLAGLNVHARGLQAAMSKQLGYGDDVGALGQHPCGKRVTEHMSCDLVV